MTSPLAALSTSKSCWSPARPVLTPLAAAACFSMRSYLVRVVVKDIGLLSVEGDYLPAGAGGTRPPMGGMTTGPMRDGPLSAGIRGAGAGRTGAMVGARGIWVTGGRLVYASGGTMPVFWRRLGFFTVGFLCKGAHDCARLSGPYREWFVRWEEGGGPNLPRHP
jgi:hypothetical protein